MYGTILRKLFTKQSEIKVAQLTGFISDKTCYHHGEQSLNMAIVNMAQRFVGSNNINILMPSGQYGTRLLGGKDHASPRYIFTYLNPIIRKVFREEDDPILNYLDDDGIPVEPEYYLPIIPMVLVNGAEGIGTGFSTQILPYNPLDIIDNIKNMMDDKPLKELKPYFHGFKGKISQEEKTFSITGNYEVSNGDLVIDELPIGMWTSVYKEFLNDLEEKKEILKFTNENTDEDVHFRITLDGKKVDDLSDKELVQKFKLIKKISITNMHLYDKDDRIKKYTNVNDILKEFYAVRLIAYTTRKNYYLDKYKKELDALKWKMKFIEEVLDDKIVVYRKKRDDIIAQLIKKKYPVLDNDQKYEYLLSLPIHSFTYEKIEELKEKITNKEEEIATLDSKDEKELWKEELDDFCAAYVKEYDPIATKVSKVKVSKIIPVPKKKK
jgi:DNA topoisomerase-2